MKLIMISAMYENGGNTLHRFLDGHENLAVFPFESQLGTGFANDFLSSLVPIRYRWPEFPTGVAAEDAYEMFWDEELKTLLRVPDRSKFRTCGLAMSEANRKAAFVDYCTRHGLSRRSLVAAYFHATFAAWENFGRSGQESHWVGYNPVQVLDADKIFADFSDGHVIHIVRNPWSGYADTKKRPFPLPLHRYAWTWSLCQQLALTSRAKYPGRFHLVMFEELIADPKAVLSRLLGNIGLPMSEQCLFPSFNGAALTEVYPWGTIRSPTSTSNLTMARSLSHQEQRAVSDDANFMIDALGYTGFLERV
ncbi:sulfotransferase [Bradyrhizobium sp. 21]|uniref:sulfotransferase family protein n=1 Tax=Bradyrhizobium sp. 21 TaxID=2782666 RepID=UPI001FFA00DA